MIFGKSQNFLAQLRMSLFQLRIKFHVTRNIPGQEITLGQEVTPGQIVI